VNFLQHLFCSSALLDLVNIMQVKLDLRNATGAKNLLKNSHNLTERSIAQWLSLTKDFFHVPSL
jgi:hypothetical protein